VDVQQKTVLHMCSEGMAQLLNPIIALAALFILVMKSVGQGSDDLSTPLAKQIKSKDVTISMNDVAGIDHVREEIEELIDYLRVRSLPLRCLPPHPPPHLGSAG